MGKIIFLPSSPFVGRGLPLNNENEFCIQSCTILISTLKKCEAYCRMLNRRKK